MKKISLNSANKYHEIYYCHLSSFCHIVSSFPMEADWSKSAVNVPDSSCHWYVAAPDNTFGEGFDWRSAPWFDAYGLQGVASIEKESVVEKLQNN